MIDLMLVSAFYAQNKVVREAFNIAKSNQPDFTEARDLIKKAMENPATKNDIKTWYVAGVIEDSQFDMEKKKLVFGQNPNEEVMYEALYNVLSFFKRIYELEKVPDDKGMVKLKYTKKLKKILEENHIYMFNGGAYHYGKKDYARAYDFFYGYTDLAGLPLFQKTKVAEKDSTYMLSLFYTAMSALHLPDSITAIFALERAKRGTLHKKVVFHCLCQVYESAKDSVNLERTLKEGLELYPADSYFLMSLINMYIYSGRNDEAIEYLTVAIRQDEKRAELYNVMARIYEVGLNDYEKAKKFIRLALGINPDYIDALLSMGRIYYNQAVRCIDESRDVFDNKEYQEKMEAAKGLFRCSMPYLEKAHAANPRDMDCMIALRGIYYHLNMGVELERIESEMKDQH